MNVFVLSTGRCGSLSFSRACSHAINFTSAHESRSRMLGSARMAFPDQHIEVDNRLAWHLGELDAAYGADAFYVHLHRDQTAVATSYLRRTHLKESIIKAYRNGVLMDPSRPADLDLCVDVCETVTANIRSFLKDKDNVMAFDMHQAETLFPRFWRWIGARGDLAAALGEWRTPHNVGPAQRGRTFGVGATVLRIRRVVSSLPSHVRDVW